MQEYWQIDAAGRKQREWSDKMQQRVEKTV
jgi:hypothetical protein